MGLCARSRADRLAIFIDLKDWTATAPCFYFLGILPIRMHNNVRERNWAANKFAGFRREFESHLRIGREVQTAAALGLSIIPIGRHGDRTRLIAEPMPGSEIGCQSLVKDRYAVFHRNAIILAPLSRCIALQFCLDTACDAVAIAFDQDRDSSACCYNNRT